MKNTPGHERFGSIEAEDIKQRRLRNSEQSPTVIFSLHFDLTLSVAWQGGRSSLVVTALSLVDSGDN